MGLEAVRMVVEMSFYHIHQRCALYVEYSRMHATVYNT